MTKCPREKAGVGVDIHSSSSAILCLDTTAGKQSWALSIFFIFFNNKKWYLAFFIQLIWLGVGFLNRTGAKIGY